MNDLVLTVTRTLHDIWVRRWIALAVAWPVAIVGAIGVMLFADRYEASAKIYVDTQTVLKPLMSGLAFQPDFEQQVAMLARTLISRPNVEHLIDTPGIGLPPGAKPTPTARDQEINRLMKAITLTPAANNSLYSITYRDTDPKRAHLMVQSLVNLFVESGVGGKRRDSEEARRFIDEQIHTYEVKLTEAENRLKDFKLRNFNVVGGSNQDYFARAAALSDEVAKLRVDLSAAENSRAALRRELASEDPQLPFDPTAATAPPSETTVRLEALKRQLDDLLRRYTDEHPDVVNTRRTIAQLERQRQAELAAVRGPGRGAATSPVYQRIRIDLAQAEATVASLQSQLAAKQSRLEQIRATAGKVPQAEAELAQLNRDYDVLRKNYEALVSRRESAFLGIKIDQTGQVAEFRMVEPPRVEPQPVFPSRKILALLVLVVAAAAGLAVSFGLSQVAPSVHQANELQALSGRPVLGSISLHIGPAEQILQRQDLRRFWMASLALVLCHLIWTAWLALRPGL